MKKILLFSWLLMVVATAAIAQLSVAPEGGNKKAMVGEESELQISLFIMTGPE